MSKQSIEAVREVLSILDSKCAPLEVKWMTYAVASHYSGLSTALIEDLALSGEIVSTNVLRKGASRGRRLIKRESLDEFIEAGLNRPPAALPMNKSRKGDAE
ncbi:hypothetical protein [Luteolibacter marinus]|uniref:hypothetical protein n=1 Tax=Luteolibacter marinus TaxID=2776705 RepID=UPI001867A86B|nr:hypothetical protein [Luteolibacter marinus]